MFLACHVLISLQADKALARMRTLKRNMEESVSQQSYCYVFVSLYFMYTYYYIASCSLSLEIIVTHIPGGGDCSSSGF